LYLESKYKLKTTVQQQTHRATQKHAEHHDATDTQKKTIFERFIAPSSHGFSARAVCVRWIYNLENVYT